MFDRIKKAARLLFTGRYDLAELSGPNTKHFAKADDRPPFLANSLYTRKQIRMKARYEWENNCYLAGLVSTLAKDVIGYTIPTLRVLIDEPGVSPKDSLKTFIEEQWIKWSTHRLINLPEKLYLLDTTKTVEGESFWYKFTDEDAEYETGISLNMNVLSSSRVTDPYIRIKDAMKDEPIYQNGNQVGYRTTVNDDGLIVDAKSGRPLRFMVSPLDTEIYGFDLIKDNFEMVDAKYMTQWYHPTRPGQFRGVSEVRQAVPIYAQLRRYLTTVMTGAETIASFAGTIKTTSPPIEGPTTIEQFTQFPITPGMLTSLPEGWEPTQFQGNTNAINVQATIDLALRECGRALDVPFGIVAGDSSKYNYSSARLDYIGYDEGTKFKRGQLSIKIMNPTFASFLLELSLINQRVREAFEAGAIYHSWSYTARPSLDPQKDASANDQNLKNNLTTLAEIYASRGKDWEEELEQKSREKKKIIELGLDIADGNAIMKDEGTSNAQNESTTDSPSANAA